MWSKILGQKGAYWKLKKLVSLVYGEIDRFPVFDITFTDWAKGLEQFHANYDIDRIPRPSGTFFPPQSPQHSKYPGYTTVKI